MNLDEVSCPFSWGMEKVVEGPEWQLISSNMEERHDNLKDLEDEFPESMLMFHLMIVYEQVLRDDLCSVEDTLEKARKSLDAIIEKKSTSEHMKIGVKHIFIGTKCNVYKKLNPLGDIEMLLNEIRSEKDMTTKELAIIYGCRCLAWSLYGHYYLGKAILSAMTAIEYEPDNGKWHFLLGQTTRRQRRKGQSLVTSLDLTEKRAFQTAWYLLKSPLTGVSLAQMYREDGDRDRAEDVYMQVFELNPRSCKIRLQLALGFIRMQQFTRAKECLGYVAERMPTSRTYLHYMAIYHEKCTKDMETACSFYRRTTERSNYAAEMDYLKCRMEVDRDFDPLTYLLSLLTKYDMESKNIIQEINATTGSWYLFQMNDVVSACKYYKETIEIDPKSTALTMHRSLVSGRKPINIYEVLIRKLESAPRNISGNHDSHQLALFQEIREMCLQHVAKPEKSNRSTIQGSWRNIQSNCNLAGMSQAISRPNTGASGNRSANGSSRADVLANDLSKMGLAHSKKQSE